MIAKWLLTILLIYATSAWIIPGPLALITGLNYLEFVVSMHHLFGFAVCVAGPTFTLLGIIRLIWSNND